MSGGLPAGLISDSLVSELCGATLNNSLRSSLSANNSTSAAGGPFLSNSNPFSSSAGMLKIQYFVFSTEKQVQI